MMQCRIIVTPIKRNTINNKIKTLGRGGDHTWVFQFTCWTNAYFTGHICEHITDTFGHTCLADQFRKSYK